MTEDQYNTLNFGEQVRLNKELIYVGRDFKLSFILSFLLTILLIGLLIYDFFTVGSVTVSILTPIISSLFPTVIGVLATIVAFSFAGLIFFISFHADDKSVYPLSEDYLFPQYLFIFQWLAFIGVCGIISCSVTIVCGGLDNWIVLVLPPLFVVSFFFIIYTLLSVLSAFTSMSYFGQIRFQYCIRNNNENKERQNASKSMPCSQSASTSATGDSVGHNFRTSKDNTSTMNLERHKLLRRK